MALIEGKIAVWTIGGSFLFVVVVFVAKILELFSTALATMVGKGIFGVFDIIKMIGGALSGAN